MSWDIVLFSSREKIKSVESLDEDQLVPADFCGALQRHFTNASSEKDHWEIRGSDYAIDYYQDEEEVSNKIFSLYGENAIYAMIRFAKRYGFQIYDTGLNAMIDVDQPEINGYSNFKSYPDQILNLNK